MDRPEWVAANPMRAEVCCCLTNNKNRGVKPNAGGDAAPVGGPNPREKNQYGQIVRWTPDGGDHRADGFAWDLFVVAGNPAVHDDDRAGSANVNAGNMFNSPDGLAFDRNGMLWIQTDGKYSDSGDSRTRATTRCWSAIPGPARSGGSWSGRGSAKSPASPGAPTAGACSSASSIPARRAAATSPTAATPPRAPA